MKNKILFLAISSIIITFSCFYICRLKTSAVTLDDMQESGLGEIGEFAYGSETPQSSITEIIAEIIKVVLSFLGIIFLILTLYGGFLWMTAGGNEDKITKAKGILVNGIIGLLIILSAYAITYFILENLIKATTG